VFNKLPGGFGALPEVFPVLSEVFDAFSPDKGMFSDCGWVFFLRQVQITYGNWVNTCGNWLMLGNNGGLSGDNGSRNWGDFGIVPVIAMVYFTSEYTPWGARCTPDMDDAPVGWAPVAGALASRK